MVLERRRYSEGDELAEIGLYIPWERVRNAADEVPAIARGMPWRHECGRLLRMGGVPVVGGTLRSLHFSLKFRCYPNRQ